MNRRSAILALLAVASQQAMAQGTGADPITILLDQVSGIDVWYQGQLVTISSQEIFIALGGVPMLEEGTKGGQ